jgi:hypothetical protein
MGFIAAEAGAESSRLAEVRGVFPSYIRINFVVQGVGRRNAT